MITRELSRDADGFRCNVHHFEVAATTADRRRQTLGPARFLSIVSLIVRTL